MAVLAVRRPDGVRLQGGRPPNGATELPGRLRRVTDDQALPELPPDLREAHEILASGAAQILPADGLAERLLAAATGRTARCG